jgi:hypothetical protein
LASACASTNDGDDAERQRVPARRRHLAARHHARAVTDVDPLAGADAPHRRGVPPLLAVEDEPVAGGDGVQPARRDEEQRRCHRVGRGYQEDMP